MDWTAHLGAAAMAAALCGVGGLLVPRMIGRLPEPEVEPEAESDSEADSESESDSRPVRSEAEPKELYADIAATAGLSGKAALWAAGSGGLAALSMGWSWSLLVVLPVVPLLVALSVVDFRTRLLPTVLVRLAAALVVVAIVVVWLLERDTSDVVRALIGAAVSFFWFFLLWFVNPRGMGYGDVRLSAVLGLALGFLGWGQLLVGMYAGFLIFAIPGLVVALVRRDRSVLRKGYPFGPFMILGALVGVVWGADLWARFTGA